MLKLVVFACLAASALAGGTGTCKVTNGKCAGQCHIDPTFDKGSSVHMSVNGTCTVDVTAATYTLKSTFQGLPVLNKENQDACKENKITLPLSMGTIDIQPAACPVKAGTTLTIPSVASVSEHAPNGKMVATLTAKDSAGDNLFDIEYDLTLA